MKELLDTMIDIIKSEPNTMKVYSYQLALADEARIAGFNLEATFLKSLSPRDSYELANWLEVF